MNRHRGTSALALWLLTWAATSAAQSPTWNTTFGGNGLTTYVQAGATRAIVVAAGADRAAAKEAVTALEARLRELSAALVMGDEALGAVSALDDAAIVARASAMPVDHVVVVRVFPGGSNAQPSVVAIVYAKDGTVVTALNGTRGQAMAAPAAAPVTTPNPAAVTPQPAQAPPAVAPAPSGVNSRAADAVSEITRDHQASREDAQRQYDEQYVAFDEMAAVTAGGSVVATWTVPHQGKYRKPLEGADFYEVTGQPELANKYRNRRTGKIGLIVGGIVGMAAATGIFLAGIGPDGMDGTLVAASGALYVGGLVAMMVGMNMDPHPIDPPEARRIADEYNQRLRQRLGLSNEVAELHIPQAPKARFSWDVYAAPQATGLTLRLDY